MLNNGRKNICVILCDVADHYQEQVCRVLTSNARIKGYNLAYFSFFLTYGVDTKNGRGEANIINLIPYENFDGFDKIAFLSGPKDHPDAVERLNEYKQGLESRNIPYDESLVYYGNFWRDRAKLAAGYFAFDLKERPQAIMCANDYMAPAVCNELISRGIFCFWAGVRAGRGRRVFEPVS